MHFKDIYQILVKKVFQDQVEEFEISDYLQKKMKDQWTSSFKKVKSLANSGFKAHEAFASEIIV